MKKIIFPVFLFSIIFSVETLYAEINVVMIKGQAAMKQGRKWLPLKTGQRLQEGSVISTSANSTVKLKIDAHDMTIKPLTTIKIFKNNTANWKNQTNIGLKHGGVTAKVNKMGDVKTSFNIATPVATSSVRGTEQEVSYGSSTGMKVVVLSGNVRVHNQAGVDRGAQGNSGFSQSAGSPKSDNPISETKADALVQIIPEGLSKEETESAKNSTSDTVPKDVQDQLKAIEPGKVNINLSWPSN